MPTYTPIPPPLTLLAGDVLLYNSSSVLGALIRFWTHSDVEHVEVWVGGGVSAASRNGIGVNIYPYRSEGLAYVLRPTTHVHEGRLLAYANDKTGTPYGWLDLLMFVGFKHVQCPGVICSQFADEALRAAGVLAFNSDYPAGEVSPDDFKKVTAFRTVWRRGK